MGWWVGTEDGGRGGDSVFGHAVTSHDQPSSRGFWGTKPKSTGALVQPGFGSGMCPSARAGLVPKRLDSIGGENEGLARPAPPPLNLKD